MSAKTRLLVTMALGLTTVVAACSSSNSNPDGPAASSQTPPMGAVAVEAWLAAGSYKSWTSEPAIHDARSPSPHSFNRIYSNSLISANATGTADWPKGAAAVKELYDTMTSTAPTGYAVYLKTADDSAAGANWYWYERVPLNNTTVPHDATTGVVADGMGSTGTALSICVGCHGAAGSNAAHTPSVGGRDLVYTPVH